MNQPNALRWPALLMLGICGCSDPAPKREWTPADHGQPEQAPPDRVSGQDEVSAGEPSGQASARAASALYLATCAGCHARDGRGLGEARPPGATLPDFSTAAWQRSRSDPQLAKVIFEGRGMMPAFGKRINDQGIAVLVHHIRTLGAESSDALPSSSPAAGRAQKTE